MRTGQDVWSDGLGYPQMCQGEVELPDLEDLHPIRLANSSRRVVNWARVFAMASRLSHTTAEAHRPSRRSTMRLLLQTGCCLPPGPQALPMSIGDPVQARDVGPGPRHRRTGAVPRPECPVQDGDLPRLDLGCGAEPLGCPFP